MLRDTKRDLINTARLLPKIEVNGKLTNKYEEYSINLLADSYCKALDENDKQNINIYISALLLRFWYTLEREYQKCKTANIEREEMLDVIYECINVACKYRAWQDPAKHTNAQACINQVINCRAGAAIMYEANLNKNTKLYTVLDEVVDDESYTTRGDLLADPNGECDLQDVRTRGIIQEMITKNKIIEAIIADNIAFKDVFKHEKETVSCENEDGEIKKYSSYSSEFWPFKLVQELNALDDKYLKYFASNYRIKEETLKLAVEAITKANNQKLYNYINKSKPIIAQCLLG